MVIYSKNSGYFTSNADPRIKKWQKKNQKNNWVMKFYLLKGENFSY